MKIHDMIISIIPIIGALGLVIGCANKSGPEPAQTTTAPVEVSVPPAGPSERPSLTTSECEAKGGRVVGDIGDGAIHRPDYTCENGQPPYGSIRATGDEPIATEGSVCCPG